MAQTGITSDFAQVVDLSRASLPSAPDVGIDLPSTPSEALGLAANLASFVFVAAFINFMFKKALDLSFGK